MTSPKVKSKFPAEKFQEPLGFEAFYPDLIAERILKGLQPTCMEDKWLVYSENEWVYFCRSWTQSHVFAIRLHPTAAGGATVIESWFNSNKDEFKPQNSEYSRNLLSKVIHALFEREPVV